MWEEREGNQTCCYLKVALEEVVVEVAQGQASLLRVMSGIFIQQQKRHL